MANLDLEELKRLVAEATPENWELVWHGNESYPFPLSIIADNGSRWVARDGTVSSPAIALLLFKAARALPELIARVERAEALIEAASGRAEEIIERANTKAENAGADTEECAYYEGRMEAAISLSNILTGDTPNV